MNKKAIAILGAIFILIVGTLGFLIYSKYSSKSPSSQTSATAPTPTPVAAATPAPTPTPASGITELTSSQVLSPVLFFNGQGITYFDNQGDLYQSNLTNNSGQLLLSSTTQLTVPPKANISKILWPAKGNDFIAEITDPTTQKTTFSYFNSTSGAYTDLPSQVESVDWMPNGTQIVYIWLDNGKASLSISNPDTTGHTMLAAMWETDDELHVSPDGTQILYYETNNSGQNNFINSVSIDGKTFKGLVKNGQNFGVLWSPDGQKFLFGKKDPTSGAYQLWVYNLTSGAIENLGLFTTVDKAVWASDSQTVYAAVPSTPSQNTGALTMDSFYKIDITTLDKQQYPADPNTPIDGENLFLDSGGSNLIFKNAQDGGLYYLNLAAQPTQ